MVSERTELFPVELESPTPHHDKLEGLLENKKLPAGDQERVRPTIERYEQWVEAMGDLEADGDDKVEALLEFRGRRGVRRGV